MYFLPQGITGDVIADKTMFITSEAGDLRYRRMVADMVKMLRLAEGECSAWVVPSPLFNRLFLEGGIFPDTEFSGQYLLFGTENIALSSEYLSVCVPAGDWYCVYICTNTEKADQAVRHYFRIMHDLTYSDGIAEEVGR